jgi:uncharacterized cupin superfamily protein
MLIEDGGETLLHAGDCATFPQGAGNGHHMINRSTAITIYLEIGSRNPLDLTTCSDIDMMSSNADGRFMRKDGTPYPQAELVFRRRSFAIETEARALAASGTPCRARELTYFG